MPTEKPSIVKRIGTDSAGYGLITLGVAFGWLPGPGGIPLIIAGLSLLSVYNPWAARLKIRLIKDGSSLVNRIFPANQYIEAIYDVVSVIALLVISYLFWQHQAVWEISLAIFLFFITAFIALMNRSRLQRIERFKHKH
jgi:hypothetical protein